MGTAHLRGLHTLHGQSQMKTVLRRERLRADRGNRPMAVVVFELSNSSWWRLRRLARLLIRRCRSTDEVGWMSARQIGVALTETETAGAFCFGNATTALAARRGLTANYTVFNYPPDEHDEHGQRSDDAVTSGRRSHEDSLAIRTGAARRGIAPAINHRAIKRPQDQAIPLQRLLGEPLPLWKRTMDVLGATVGLVVAIPVMALAALLVHISSAGPVIFRQVRAGHGNSRFTIFKFRTMVPEAESLKASLRTLSEQDGPAFKMRDDPRVTLIGRILRATSLDELPQLWNVLIGHMSLVGPRPLPVEESEECSRWQRRRMDVVPGLTCIWQVRGRSRVKFDDWMRMDMEYIRNRSFLNDLKILVLTLPAVILRRGAH